MTVVNPPHRLELLGDQPWIESASGFPHRSWGDEIAGRPDPTSVVVSTPDGDFTGGQVGDVVAFTEFLAGVAFDGAEREWLIDGLTRDFEAEPIRATAELKTIALAIEIISSVEPIVRTDQRHKALTSMYRLDVRRERLGLAENPIMVMIRARNPALVVDQSGVVITADAVEARHAINRIILTLADRRPEDLPYLRTNMADGIERLSYSLKSELAGSWIRLVLLRSWLADLEPLEFDRLRPRVADVIDTATDLGQVGMMLSFRSMIEAFSDSDDDADDDW